MSVTFCMNVYINDRAENIDMKEFPERPDFMRLQIITLSLSLYATYLTL